MSKHDLDTKTMSLDELRSNENQLREQLFKLQLQKTTGQLGNTAELRKLRKNLARVKTAQTQKAASKSNEGARK